MAVIQDLVDGATTLTIDKSVPTAMSVSRGQVLRTQSRSTSIYKFVVGLNPGLSYDNATTRGLLQDYDTIGRMTSEAIKLGSVSGNQYLTEYMGDLSGANQNLLFCSANASGSNISLFVTNLSGESATDYIVKKGDFIQPANSSYPYQATADVQRGTDTTVVIPVHREVLETTIAQANVLIGNNCTFKVKIIDQPPYSIIPGRYVEWGGDLQLMEDIGL